MVSGLLVLVVLALVQLTLALWVRTTLIDAAAEGAREAALHGGAPEAAEARVREVAGLSAVPIRVEAVAVRTEPAPGYELVAVDVSAPLPVLGPLGPSGSLRVTGHAVREE